MTIAFATIMAHHAQPAPFRAELFWKSGLLPVLRVMSSCLSNG